LPLYHPIRPLCASRLGFRLSERYALSNQQDDLDKSILYLTESLLFSPLSWPAHGPMIGAVLSHLALSLGMRSSMSKEPEDAIYAAKYFRYLRDADHAPLAFLRQSVTSLLVTTLVVQLELNASDVVQTLEEMAVLTHELLTLDPSSADTTDAIAAFARAPLSDLLLDSFSDRPQALNQIMKCLRLARMHRPEMGEVHVFLAKCLFLRYTLTLGDELDEAVSIMDEVIVSSSSGDKLVAKCQEIVANIAVHQSIISRPENYEEVIYRARAFLASSSPEEALYPAWSHVLENAANNRLRNFGPIGGLEPSSSPVLPPVLAELEMTPLDGLLEGIRNYVITDIDEAIEKGRSILVSSDPNDAAAPLLFGELLFEAFERTNKIEYLNESIDTLRPILAHPLPKFLRLMAYALLSASLFARSLISPDHCPQDLYGIVELFPQYLNAASGVINLVDRFHLTCGWAAFARSTQHPSVPTAYETAFSSMQDSLQFAPTLQLQHATLVTSPNVSLPLDYASYQLDLGQIEKAIETLERGRALLWSQMRHLRTSADQLFEADPDLGHEFAAVSRELEELTKSIPPSHEIGMDDVVADDLRAGDEFGRVLLRQRGLLKERDKLISQVRALPGSDRFLTSPSFDTLRSAASSGPVIIINHSRWRSDILILLSNMPPSIIPTPDDFYDCAIALRSKLLDSRINDGLDSTQYDDTLASVLAELYELVGKPVIERLGRLHVKEQSRIWWCPTSAFCSLPLHAMGPIPSDDGELRYFLDLYVSSYTPSLSALIQSRSRDIGLRSSDRPSVLLVAQPDPSLPTVGGEIQVVQALDTDVTTLISGAATPAAVFDSFQYHRFVHFACHGTLESGKPFEAGFELHRDERLTLLEIVRADLPTAEFAFLSACHTAEVTEGSIMDEGLHLAAAVQYSGFRSVVGTMWAMVDEDGQELAKNFYKSLFSNSRDLGTPYHERSAKALRFAVKKLRQKKRITLERWVNFVHYGA
jgi:tetratricopeptide (TPR) repeat protein